MPLPQRDPSARRAQNPDARQRRRVESTDVVRTAAGCGAGGDATPFPERGFSFRDQNLVADMRSLAVLRATGGPVVFDATHSVQLPGAQGTSSGGQREFVPVLARAAVAAGISGLFVEAHPDPPRALPDEPNAWPLARMEPLLATLVELDRVAKSRPFEEDLLTTAAGGATRP
jgi:2-dehydro-3-deoxyphosphooctonate aldolase (KDO 8-P synthase)